MTKVLVATEKPFAKAAVDSIRGVCDKAGYELVLLEKYADPSELINAVADVDAMIANASAVTLIVFFIIWLPLNLCLYDINR